MLREAIRRLKAEILCLQEAAIPGLLESLDYPTCLTAPETGLAILSRFPAAEHRPVLYRTVSPLEEAPRGCLLAKLQIGSSDLWVGTTHLSWKAEDGASRLGQMEELIELTRPWKDRLALAGDFNSVETDKPLRRLKEAGFADLFGQLHPEDPGITWDNQNPFIQSHSVRFPDRRIDLIFVHEETLRGLACRACAVACHHPDAEGIYPSDHYGVLSSLEPA